MVLNSVRRQGGSDYLLEKNRGSKKFNEFTKVLLVVSRRGWVLSMSANRIQHAYTLVVEVKKKKKYVKSQCPGHSSCSINIIGSGGSDNVEITVAMVMIGMLMVVMMVVTMAMTQVMVGGQRAHTHVREQQR